LGNGRPLLLVNLALAPLAMGARQVRGCVVGFDTINPTCLAPSSCC